MCVHDGRGWGVKGKADLVGLVREREKERETETETERQRERVERT